MVSMVAVSLLLAGECELTLSVNATTVRQCDPLIVKAIVANHGVTPVQITGEQGRGGSAKRVRYERKIGDAWVVVPMMRDHAGQATFPRRLGPLLEPQATYAEYETLFLERRYFATDKQGKVVLEKRGKKQIAHAPGSTDFVFDNPGTYELRAVVETSEGRLESKPIRVEVQGRAPRDLQRVDEARKKRVLSMLGRDNLPIEIPQELIALADVGGNIGEGVKNMLLLQGIIDGNEQVGDEDVAKFLHRRMEGIEWEVGLLVLGGHYRQKNDVKRLAQIADALPDPTFPSNEWINYLELLTPPRFVPSKPKTQSE